MRKFKVDEYEVVEDLANGVFKVNRHDEYWKDLVGDNFTMALIDEIERLESKLSEVEGLLSESHDVMDDVHLYDTDLYREISAYLYSENED